MERQDQAFGVDSGVITRRNFLGATAGLAAGMALPGQSWLRSNPLSAQRTAQSNRKLSGTLTYYDGGTLENPAGKRLIAEYERLHPGVKITTVASPPQGTNEVFTLMEGGAPPDLFTLATNMFPWQNVIDDWWVDLTPYANAPNPYVPGNRRWTDLLQPSVVPTLIFKQGQMYSLTTTGFDNAFFYNKEIFQKMKVEPPTTWAEMVTVFQTVKKGGYIPFFFELGELQYADPAPGFLPVLEDTIMSKTIDRLNPSDPSGFVSVAELVRGIKDGVYSARNADYQECWVLFKSLAPYMQLGPAAATSFADGVATFETGKVATWFEGSFLAPAITNIDWGAFVMPNITPATTKFGTNGPQRKGGYGATAGEPWAVPVKTQKSGKLDLAIDFIYFLSTPANSSAYSAANGLLDLERGATVSSRLEPFVTAGNSVSRLAVAELSLPQNFFVTRSRLVQSYVLGVMSLSEAMSQMQTEMNAAAAQAEKEYGL